MMKETKDFFRSQGGGQYFKREGDQVKIICLYEFNPSIERTKFNVALIEALHCEPCEATDFEKAEQEVARLLDLPIIPVHQRA
ncbi:hypothetical protein [Telluribacter sp.]|jgi:hypothetical protein|uniref:hypothetical protein n=1 Tax=Telluribacter sp. TaxID=1978767 RepID=UPI002E123D0F|nr:hypothetical protein [Telluribacter sp.]